MYTQLLLIFEYYHYVLFIKQLLYAFVENMY